MLRKTMPFQILDVKADAGSPLEFSGYASTFGNVDHHNDIIEKGAFLKTLQEWEQSGRTRIKTLWQHDPWQPVGLPLELREDDKGLFIRNRASDTTENRDRMVYVKDKVVDKMSIGFEIVKASRDETTGVRRIQEIKLWEVSLVTFPANEMASVDDVKRMIKSLRDTDISSSDMMSMLDEIKSLITKGEPLKSTLPGTEPTDKSADPLLQSDDDKLDALVEDVLKSLKQL